MSQYIEYQKNLKAKATIQDVVNIVNATLAHHIKVRHERPWYKTLWVRARTRLRRKPRAQLERVVPPQPSKEA